jgi:26S proteasome regulatory subunit (ATPase 3-interacting protein)
MESKLAAMRSGKVAVVSPETKAADEALAVALFNEWTRRRRIFRDVYDSLLESVESKKPAQLKEEVRKRGSACAACTTA